MAGCSSAGSNPPGGSAPTSTTSPTTTTTSHTTLGDVADFFEADENAANTVADRVQATVETLPADATGPQALQALEPLISAAQKYQTQITDLPWSPPFVSDAHALVDAVGSLIGVMESVSSQNAFSIQSWVTQFESAAEAEHSAANILRHDLGLPPES